MTELITYTGKRIDPFEVHAEDICIRDIAHHLSNLCRFGGATQDFYSVAQHSVHVSASCKGVEHMKWGLLHDAAEAYLGDVVRPLKGEMDLFNHLEKYILARVSHRFNLEWPMPDAVLRSDDAVLEWELARFVRGESIQGGMGPKPAKNLFMAQYKNLFGGECPCGCSG